MTAASLERRLVALRKLEPGSAERLREGAQILAALLEEAEYRTAACLEIRGLLGLRAFPAPEGTR